ncbi:hypothetical protein [Lysobacter sp. CA199]|uniref:hypothetical protein n=1 Tax=Lysobacter sp. CA199 TaxID=3455608 RepID=UPI003F8D31C7
MELSHAQLRLIAQIHDANAEFGVAHIIEPHQRADAEALRSVGLLWEHTSPPSRSTGYSVTIAGLDTYNLAIRARNAQGAWKAIS